MYRGMSPAMTALFDSCGEPRDRASEGWIAVAERLRLRPISLVLDNVEAAFMASLLEQSDAAPERWWRPRDLGARGASHDANVLDRLASRCLLMRRARAVVVGGRPMWEYRLSEMGRLACELVLDGRERQIRQTRHPLAIIKEAVGAVLRDRSDGMALADLCVAVNARLERTVTLKKDALRMNLSRMGEQVERVSLGVYRLRSG
jgi:hypothetical protein